MGLLLSKSPVVGLSNGSPARQRDLPYLGHPLVELERTPEAAAVSGVYRESQGAPIRLPGIPQTNLPLVSTAVLDRPLGTPRKPTEKDDLLYYLEQEATSPSTLLFRSWHQNFMSCGCWCLIGQDEDENRIAKRLACGREWCEHCRDISHRRRISRVLPRLFQICPMSYIVITFPLEVRWMMRNPRALALIGKKVRRLLRKLGYRKIYTRWHFFGKHGEKYHPHLNVLCDGEWLYPEQLVELKDLIRRKLLPRSIAKTIGKDLDIRYRYRQTPKKIMHTIKYVTKASFRDIEWDEPLASALRGFHNGCFAGFWNDSPKWKLTGTDKKFNALLPLAEGKHPVSGKPIVWNSRPFPFVLVLMEEPVDIGGGYYLLPPIRPPPVGRLDFSNLIELPDGDYRKHPNAVRRSIDRASELISRREDYESYS
ncbi:hypothetical protein ES708_19270 [subsurface metagenome]